MMKDESFKDFVLDQLSGAACFDCRAMFGGYGLYRSDVFFGIIHKSRLYFKTDQKTVQEYVDAGMKPFRPSAKQTLKSYYEVPVDVIEDGDLLIAWAKNALRAKLKQKEM
jgi:DNA transformation protein